MVVALIGVLNDAAAAAHSPRREMFAHRAEHFDHQMQTMADAAGAP